MVLYPHNSENVVSFSLCNTIGVGRTLMKKILQKVNYTASTKIQVLAPAQYYTFLLDGGYTSAVKKKEEVVQGDIIATCKNKHLYAPCDGVVESASDKEIRITPQSEITKERLTPLSFEAMEHAEQLAYLEANGITSLWKNTKSVQVCIINALPTDAVSVHYMPFLFAEEKETIEIGVRTLMSLYPSARMRCVVPQGCDVTVDNTEMVQYAKSYPYTLTPLVKRHIEGEDALGVLTLSLLDVWHIGSIVKSGKPLTETILVVNDSVVKCAVGYPLRSLFEELAISVDTIAGAVVNGVMNGSPLCSLEGGVLPSCYSLHTFTQLPPVTEDPCVSCGYCTSVCPVGIRVHLLNQYAERTIFEACQEEHLEACIECGMCDYVCITKRPIMQYIRNAKQHVKKLLPMG